MQGLDGTAWQALGQAEKDAAYDNAAAVPGSADMIAGWYTSSKAFRERKAFRLNLPYGPKERNAWDVLPPQSTHSPCLVFIHGGYWQVNSRDGFSVFAEGVAAHGWGAALPGYTLAPEASLTAIVAEMHAALDWLAANRQRLGLSGPIIISGWSAGGTLAALLLSHPLVTAGMAISGLFELAPLCDTYRNEKLQLSDEEMARFSPARLPIVQKPFAIAYGTAELPAFIHESRSFHEKRAVQHAPGVLLPVSGAHHYSVLEPLRNARSELVHALLRLGEGEAG